MKVCKSFFSKFRGLMFSKKKELLFVFDEEKRRSVHMFFVFYNLNIVFLDKNSIIKDIKCLKPFQVCFPKCKIKYIFETPYPIDLKIGDKLDIYND